MKIIEQKYKCPHCGVETTGRFNAEVDEERIAQNLQWKTKYEQENKEYLKLRLEYLNTISRYEKIVRDHNACIESHKNWLGRINQDKLWRTLRNYKNNWHCMEGSISIIGTDCYPKINEPQLPELCYTRTKYITCPTCDYKNYIE